MEELMLTRLRWWWMRRRLADAVLAKLIDGTGVTSAEWPVCTAKEDVLAWIDEQFAAARTPYGISAAKILIFRRQLPDRPWKEWLLVERALWRRTVRDEVALVLE